MADVSGLHPQFLIRKGLFASRRPYRIRTR